MRNNRDWKELELITKDYHANIEQQLREYLGRQLTKEELRKIEFMEPDAKFIAAWRKNVN